MEFRNLTPFPALAYSALDADDQVYRVVVMRVSYRLQSIPGAPGQYIAAVVDRSPPPLCLADEFWGDMNVSSPRYESDLSPFKPRCDVIVNATAYAPGGSLRRRFDVRLTLREPDRTDRAEPRASRVPSGRGVPEARVLIDKTLSVCGERAFQPQGGMWKLIDGVTAGMTLGAARLNPWSLTEPALFRELPIRYEYAFGGQCRIEADSEAADRVPAKYRLTQEQLIDHPDRDRPPVAHTAFKPNPLGRGFVEPWYLHALRPRELPAPRIELAAHPVTADHFWRALRGGIDPEDPAFLPAGLGLIGRPWSPRLARAGTYDQAWLEHRHPYLPKDFDFGYWNGASDDQQIAYPPPDIEIELTHLTPDGTLRTRLPGHRAFVLAWFEGGVPIPMRAWIDTLIIDAEERVVTCLWRCLVPAALPVEMLEARFEIDPSAPLLKWMAPSLDIAQETAERYDHES